jgi:hypothetical protein
MIKCRSQFSRIRQPEHYAYDVDPPTFLVNYYYLMLIGLVRSEFRGLPLLLPSGSRLRRSLLTLLERTTPSR